MISAVVHTYNEEKNIRTCLSSLTWVQEIVLIDMGSTDKTCEIAREYKAKIFSHPYTGFVEPARNFGISKTKNDWILIVDADEEIPATLVKYLRIEEGKPSADFYRIARKNIIFGKWIKYSGWWPDYQIRFFKKGSISWTEKIHGVPFTQGIGIDIEAKESLGIIHHNYQTLDQYLIRVNRYASIAAKEIYLSNQNFRPEWLFTKPLQEFINRFFVWEGYKDNMHGLALSLLQSFAQLITYLKLWELYSFPNEKLDLPMIDRLITQDFRQKKFWISKTMLYNSPDLLRAFIIRLKRVLSQYV